MLRIASVFVLVSAFWALFDQKASSWVLQAECLNLKVWGFTLLPSQIQSANPVLVMVLIPYTQRLLYPTAQRLGFPLTPLRRMTVGLVLASLATAVIALIQGAIDRNGPGTITVRWQFPRLLPADDGRGDGVDHRARVRLQPGAAPDEVDDHGPVAADRHGGQRASSPRSR